MAANGCWAFGCGKSPLALDKRVGGCSLETGVLEMSAGRTQRRLAVIALIAAAQPGTAQELADDTSFVVVEGHVYGLEEEGSGTILLNERTGQTWLLAHDEEGRAMWYLLRATEQPVPMLR